MYLCGGRNSWSWAGHMHVSREGGLEFVNELCGLGEYQGGDHVRFPETCL